MGITWSDDLYVGKSCRRRVEKLKSLIQDKSIHQGVYLIVRSNIPGNLLEIIPSIQLIQPEYPLDDLYVIGVAGYRQECDTLLMEIVEELHQKGWRWS